MKKNSHHTINNQDVVEWANEYDGPPFHALLTDAPYHLTTITKRFGNKGSAPAKHGKDGAFTRLGKGFMGQEWDGGDVSFRPETWAALGKHLYPGAFGMTFGGARTAHRIAVAIEDAGFIIHPMIVWCYGCLSEDTEILTSEGFKPYHKAIEGTDVLCYNSEHGSLEWNPVQELVVYDYKDTAYQIKSNTTDQLVSRNHRCPVERDGRIVFQFAETLQSEEIVPILERVSNMPLPIHRDGCERILDKGILLKELRNDGNRKKKSRRKNSFAFEKAEKSYLSSMRKRVFASFGLDEEGKDSNMLQTLQRSFERGGVEETCPQGEELLEQEVRKSIGQENDRSIQSSMEGRLDLPTKKGSILESVYQVCALSNALYQYGKERWLCNGASVESGTDNWSSTDKTGSSSSYQSQCRGQSNRKLDVIQEQQGTQTVRTWSGYSTTLATITPIWYEGKVWCVRVSTGAFVARRNGKIFITGNSGFPKATRIKGHKEFDGHRYGMQALKPAAEPIIVWQKPYDGKPVDNIIRTGAGALNIDAGRIASEPYTINTWDDNAHPFGNGAGNKFTGRQVSGRWPANFILDDSMASALDAQSGDSKSISSRRGNGIGKGYHGSTSEFDTIRGISDEGGASRYFYNVQTQFDSADPFIYAKKASGKERNAGLEKEPEHKLGHNRFDKCANCGGYLLQNQSRKSACKCDNPKREDNTQKNPHPTVKPLDLCRYLASLLLPPDDYAPRRILVPFSGVSSEMIGCLLAGWEYVEGIELSKDYIRVGEKRIKYWVK